MTTLTREEKGHIADSLRFLAMSLEGPNALAMALRAMALPQLADRLQFASYVMIGEEET